MQKDRSLKLRSNFLSKCKPLGTIIQFILFNKCSHFNPSYSFLSSVTVEFTRFFVFLRLFPFNRGRRFTGHVIHNAVYALHFVDNAAGHSVQHFIGDTGPVAGHTVT